MSAVCSGLGARWISIRNVISNRPIALLDVYLHIPYALVLIPVDL